MDRYYYQKVFSNERMEKYFSKYLGNEEKAIRHYHINIEISEGFYSSLSMFEVALRNSLNRELTKKYDDEWYLRFQTIPGLENLIYNIKLAKRHIDNRKEEVTPNKLVAELTLGFWVRLFNVEYEHILWKSLRKAFPYLEKMDRQRKNVSAPINKIRDFRNRVFHHEPISWNLDRVHEMHDTLLKVMGWLNSDLPGVAKKNDRIPRILHRSRIELGQN